MTDSFEIEEAANTRNQRDRDMVTMRLAGKTLQEIGDEFQITKERVRQILKQCGLDPRQFLRTNRSIYKKRQVTNG